MKNKVGIPRGLMYYYYFPSWKIFLKEMGLKVIVSPPTNKKILDNGVKIAVDDICLPFKVYYGHVLELLDKVDYLFVPRFISLGKNNYVCPKFMGLPDMLRSHINDLPELIEPTIDLRKGIMPVRTIAHKIGKQLNKNYITTELAYWKAVKKHKEFKRLQQQGHTAVESINLLEKKQLTMEKKIHNGRLSIAVLGHCYITNDKYISMDMINYLSEQDINIFTVEMFNNCILEKAATRQSKKLFWIYNREVMGSAFHMIYDREQVDGIIQVTAFGCGPDSLVKELVEIKCKHKSISVLNLNLDEHTGEAGLITRLEAFIDLLQRKKMMA
ncbi:MAG: acyl-CoA dehydratase activase-related protein [Halothermotrichaceae bacterium]